MRSSVTYLLGAGASAQYLPTIDQLPDRLAFIAGAVSSQWRMSDLEITGQGSDQHYSITQRITEDLNWLARASSDHASVDTFAKKLFITKNGKELIKLKNALAIYFVLEEALNKIDIRYDSFLASILMNDQYSFPENVRILSWNYDSQLERAYSILTGNKDLVDCRYRLTHVHKRSTYQYNGKFALIKLNGYNGVHDSNDSYEFCTDLFDIKERDKLAEVFKSYKELVNPMNGLKTSISFAWETSPNEEGSMLHRIYPAVSHTEVLVVIGYSFPFFNREIDREIFNRMINLRKVYFQSPEAALLMDKFKSVRDTPVSQLIPIGVDQKQFFLPPEL